MEAASVVRKSVALNTLSIAGMIDAARSAAALVRTDRRRVQFDQGCRLVILIKAAGEDQAGCKMGARDWLCPAGFEAWRASWKSEARRRGLMLKAWFSNRSFGFAEGPATGSSSEAGRARSSIPAGSVAVLPSRLAAETIGDRQ